MAPIIALFKRDLILAYHNRAELMQPMMFFMLVISLFPLAVGPNRARRYLGGSHFVVTTWT